MRTISRGRVNRNMLRLVIGDKQLSSWSMRAWFLLRQLALPFEEIALALDTPGFAAAYRATFAGRARAGTDRWCVSCLGLARDRRVCQRAGRRSRLACEPAARARARSLSAEMHSGFAALRSQWPFAAACVDCANVLDAAARADLSRIESIWSECRERCAQDGPWLFGRFSIADAMYAPVALRCRTYGAHLVRRPRRRICRQSRAIRTCSTGFTEHNESSPPRRQCLSRSQCVKPDATRPGNPIRWS